MSSAVNLLSTLESYRRSSGDFHLKLVYPSRAPPNFNEWLQSSNPVTVSGAPQDYHPINIGLPDADTPNAFGGLQQGGAGGTILHNYDSSYPDRNWFAIADSPSFPGCCGVWETEVQLYVIPAATEAQAAIPKMCGGYACVARKHDGTAVAWGHGSYGGDASSVDLTNVADAMCGDRVCVARKHDGTAVAWGDGSYGGDVSSVDLTNVADAMCGCRACVARKHDGTAVAWGSGSYGGDASSVDLTNVADAMCGGRACLARKHDGTDFAWGS
jgi:hypothetical protein